MEMSYLIITFCPIWSYSDQSIISYIQYMYNSKINGFIPYPISSQI